MTYAGCIYPKTFLTDHHTTIIDYDTAWASAGCLNTLPLPYNNVNDRPNYSTQVGSESALSTDEDLRYMSTSQSNSFNSRSLNVARRHTVVRYVAMAVHF